MKNITFLKNIKEQLKLKKVRKSLAIIFGLVLISLFAYKSEYFALLLGQKSNAAVGEAKIFISPSQRTINSRSLMEVWITSETPVVFASGEIKFDNSLLQLSDEPVFVGDLSRIVKATSRNKGNTEGVISFALGLDPTLRDNPPKGTFKIAELYFSPQPNTVNKSTTLAFESSSVQIVFNSTTVATNQIANAQIAINPNNSPTTVTTRPPSSAPTQVVSKSPSTIPSPTRIASSPNPQPTLGTGTTLTFTSAEDVRLNKDKSKSNYKGGTSLRLDNKPEEQFLIKYNVTGINGRKVTRAYMRLYSINDSDKGGNFRVISNQWSESSVNWNNAPQGQGSPIASLGKIPKNQWVQVDITSIITKDGTYSFRVDTTSTDGADYASTERSTSTIPQLIVIVE